MAFLAGVFAERFASKQLSDFHNDVFIVIQDDSACQTEA